MHANGVSSSIVTGALQTLSGKRGLRIGACSIGIMRIRNLRILLPFPDCTIGPAFGIGKFDVYIGWSNKPSGRRARRLAERTGKPMLLLEDAFLRSYAPKSVSGEHPLGIVLDDEGIYYDSSAPSRLERLIADSSTSTEAEEEGQNLVNLLRRLKVSKYNNFQLQSATAPAESQAVLLVDQTWQDQSVIGAGADERSFSRLIEAARDENPGAQLIVKLHPEVMAGKKKGYLKDLLAGQSCTFLTDNVNPWDLFGRVSKIYTVSSQLGFDALIAGKPVRCFGLPFYAGWGLTDDDTACSRRHGQRPGLGSIVYSAYKQYASYISAFDAEATDVESVASQLATIRDAYQQNSRLAAFFQITPWKRSRCRAMFSPETRDKPFCSNTREAIDAARSRDGALVAWASRIDDELEAACKSQGVPLYRLEDGYVRSVGLGDGFHLPMSLILDDLGIYYDARRPSRLEELLNETDFDEHLLARARTLQKTLVDQKINKYNLRAERTNLNIPAGRHVILVPGQVDDDASIKYGGAGVDSLELLRRTRADNPEAFIIFKPHPDVVSGFRSGLNSKEQALRFADRFVDQAGIEDLLADADAVHTISSLTGFEALLRGIPVTCHGLPFYAGWGLTTDLSPCSRRQRQLSLDQLVAGALILYPRYYDPVSKLPCDPETIIRRIAEQRSHPDRPSLLRSIRSWYGKVRRRLS
jgi:capsular polysaccharide export protein